MQNGRERLGQDLKTSQLSFLMFKNDGKKYLFFIVFGCRIFSRCHTGHFKKSVFWAERAPTCQSDAFENPDGRFRQKIEIVLIRIRLNV